MKSIVIEPLLSEEAAAALATPEDLALARAFGSAKRRREFLTWRAVVRRALGADVQIAYNAVGAPVVANSNFYISVSHSRNYVAVCISDAPCAVDLEAVDRDFGRVAPRYMTASERLLSCDPAWPGVVWCAKEALYKFAGQTGLDLLFDLRIEAFDSAAGQLTGCIKNGEPVRLSVSFRDGNIVVYIL